MADKDKELRFHQFDISKPIDSKTCLDIYKNEDIYFYLLFRFESRGLQVLMKDLSIAV
jgi:hypothetical protein